MTSKKFIRDIGIIGLTQVLTNLGSFLLLPLITKTLGTYDYGLWAQISVTISLLSPLALLGLSMTFVRFLSAEKDINRIREGFYSIFLFVLSTGIIVSLFVFTLSDFLAITVLNDPMTSYYIKSSSFLILLSTLEAISLFYFRIFRQIQTYGLLMLCETFGKLFISFILLITGFGILGVIGANLIVQGCIIIIELLLIISQIGFAIPKFDRLGEFLRYGGPLTPNSLIYWITNSSDRYIVGIYLGLNAVGVYSAAYGIGNLLQLFVTPIQLILFPELSKLYDENKIDMVKTYLRHSIQYFLLIAIPSVVGLSILARPILEILTTPAFAAGSTVIPFVALAGLFFGIFQITINITQLVKNTQFDLLIQIIAAVANLVLNILLIPFIGIMGAAFATLIAYILMAGVCVYISFKYISFDLGFGFILKSIIASVIMTGALLFFYPQNIIHLLLAIGLGIVVYFLSMAIMKGVGKKEFDLIKEMVVKKA
jgi:O-antigen/teichoic acid export membrane protein